MKRYIRPLVILAVIGLVALMLTLLPRGYDTDLTQVGAGEPAAVLIHDPNIVQSGNLMHAVDRVRDDFEPQLNFFVADQNLPDGVSFAERHALRIATMALFSPDGELIDVYTGPADAATIGAWLAEQLRPR
jgi:hypothetical protein